MRHKLVIAVALLCMVALSACTTTPTGQVTAQDETIKLGAPLALTGYASTWGEAELQAALLAVEEINAAGGVNGKQLELVVEDIETDSKTSVSSTLKLVDVDNVDVILGTTWLDTHFAAASISNDRDILMVTPSALITAIQDQEFHRNIFSLFYRGDKQMGSLPEYFASQGIQKIAIVHTQDIYWQDLVSHISKNADAHGIEIVEYIEAVPGTTDYKTTISKIKQADPDMIFFGFNSEDGLAAFLKQRKEMYPESKLFSTEHVGIYVDSSDFDGLLDDIDFVEAKVSESAFTTKYTERYNVEPVFSASNMYDAVYVVAQAIKATGSTESEILRNYLRENKFDTATFGTVGFDELNGIDGGTFVVKSIDHNEITTIAEFS